MCLLLKAVLSFAPLISFLREFCIDGGSSNCRTTPVDCDRIMLGMYWFCRLFCGTCSLSPWSIGRPGTVSCCSLLLICRVSWLPYRS